MRFLVFVMSLFSVSCASVATPDPAAAGGLRKVTSNGVSITIPADWRVEASDGRFRATSANQSEAVAVEAIPVRAGQEAAGLLRELVEQGRVGPLLSPGILAIRGDRGMAQALLQGRSGSRAQALVVLRGSAATLYLAMAPEARFRQRLPELVGMLRTFSIGAGETTGAAEAPRMRFVRVAEPNENSYSMEFPAGWRSEVLLLRVGPNQKRSEASAVAPEGNATIFSGDRNLGSYAVPTQFMASLGFREGMMYRPGPTTELMLLRYMPGAQFGPYWLQRKLPQARQLALRDRPDLAQRLAAERYRAGNVLNATLHVGEMDFEYRGQRGSVILGTEIYGCEMNACTWSVAYLNGYFAAPEREEEARAALAHAVGSARVNPEWWFAENRQGRINHEAAMKSMNEVNQIMRDTMAQRAESNDRIARVRGDLLSGTYRVVDPATNEQTTVQAGSNYYYRVNNTNTVIGTNVEQTPVDLSRMLILDWEARP